MNLHRVNLQGMTEFLNLSADGDGARDARRGRLARGDAHPDVEEDAEARLHRRRHRPRGALPPLPGMYGGLGSCYGL